MGNGRQREKRQQGDAGKNTTHAERKRSGKPVMNDLFSWCSRYTVLEYWPNYIYIH